MNKLLSIIIPTRNRQAYCLESIKSILVDIDDRCEIIIQDNSANNSLEELIEPLNTSKIIYNYNPKPLSFVDNFEEALNLSSGKYFIILGDDDSTTDSILPIVEWMEKNGVESVSSTFVVDYIWPNSMIPKYEKGLLSIPPYEGSVEDIDVAKNLERLIENGFLTYQSFNLPRTYHGIVRRSCMDKVKELGGRYFGGLTPDIYSTIALSCVIKNHKVVAYPFSIAGACPASATVNATVGGHAGKLMEAPHFNNRGEYQWEKVIPRYYSVETIWAETAIKALKGMRHQNWERMFNRYKLYIYSIFFNRKYIFNLSVEETLKLNLGISKIHHIYNLFSSTVKLVYTKYLKKEKSNKVAPSELINDIENLDACKAYVYKKLEKVFKFYEITD